MRRRFLIPLSLIPVMFLAVAAASAGERPGAGLRDRLETELNTQAEAWNQGDLERFTSVYTEDATFVTPTGITTGRQAVLDRYKERYPDQAAMGKLELEILKLLPLRCRNQEESARAASVIARWTLRYPEKAERKTVSGHTLLVFLKEGSTWKIAQDASM